MPYVTETAAQTFTRSQYRWEVIPWRVAVLPPCIDAFAPKNQPLDENAVGAILDAAGIVPADDHAGSADFVRQDGTRGQVIHPADMIEDRRLIGGAPIICQVSRWDPLKDHVGVLRAFVSHAHCDTDAQLVLAGPSLGSVNDDPEGERTFSELVRSWEALARRERERVHICRVPMDDSEANAAVINALQRRSDVIVQKSLAEGFGLTVAEAMWKCRPTVASRVGGIQDQIEPGESGLLVDPTDPAELRGALTSLLSDPEAARQMGARGRRRVAESYLAPSYLIRQCTLIHEVLEAPVGTAHPVRDRVGPRSAIALGH
jgi:trehalose synthase